MGWQRELKSFDVFDVFDSPFHLGVAPSQDSSEHQDDYIFSRGSRTKPSFTTGILGGPHPTYN